MFQVDGPETETTYRWKGQRERKRKTVPGGMAKDRNCTTSNSGYFDAWESKAESIRS